MTPTRPNCDPDRRYNQKEAAAILGVERHTVRRYELAGIIRFQIHKATNRKFTTGRNILKCWEAAYL